jgi:hypothetical protein
LASALLHKRIHARKRIRGRIGVSRRSAYAATIALW